jgi:hypothetical protein
MVSGGSVGRKVAVQLSEVALLSHNPCPASERGGYEAPQFHDGSRRRGGVSGLGRRAAEADAGGRQGGTGFAGSDRRRLALRTSGVGVRGISREVPRARLRGRPQFSARDPVGGCAARAASGTGGGIGADEGGCHHPLGHYCDTRGDQCHQADPDRDGLRRPASVGVRHQSVAPWRKCYRGRGLYL